MQDEIKVLTDEELEISFVDDAFKTYMQEIKRYPILSAEQQTELGNRKDKESKNLLVKCNLRLVVSVALKYKSQLRHLKILDIIQEGNMGLMRAVETYDPSKGAFSTYAIPWIKQKIRRAITNKDSEIRKPSYLQEATHQYLRLVREYEKKCLTLPTDDIICDILDFTPSILRKIKDSLSQTIVSLNQPINEDESDELEDIIATDNNAYDSLVNRMDNDSLLLVIKEILSPLQYFIIYYRILNNEQKTLEYIASCLNITRERVRQIETKATQKIKPYVGENSHEYKNVLNKIRNREGNKYRLLKKTPLTPNQITKYLYIKDDLTELERKLYELKIFGNYQYNSDDLATILEISLEELNQVLISLKEKISNKFSNVEPFKNFQTQIIKTYNTSIFDLYTNTKEKNIDYRSLEEKYSSLSLEEILQLFKDINYNLTPEEERLLSNYFGIPENRETRTLVIEKEINIIKFGFKRHDHSKHINDLYKTYRKIRNEFSEDQQLYLECYIFGKKSKKEYINKYPNLKKDRGKILKLLERKHYHIFEYFENSFTKEKWLEVRKKYSHRFTKQKLEILDLYFGLFGRPYSTLEISKKFNMDYIAFRSLFQPALELAMRLQSGTVRNIEIDKNLYIPYVLMPYYDFVPETREILKMYLIENKTYEEISKLTGLNKIRISNIITSGIRRIDYYRFHIIEPFIIDKTELDEFYKTYSKKTSLQERQIIELKYFQYLENSDISKKLGLDSKTVNIIISRFNSSYSNFKIKDVNIDITDIINELSLHCSENVLTDREIEFASFYYGIPTKYNENAITLSKDEIMSKMNLNDNVFSNIEQSIERSLKEKKLGLKKPDLIYISRDRLQELLNDIHLPISDKERDIICHLLELNDYKHMTFEELSEKIGDSKRSIKTRYQRAIISIYKYINHEIEGKVNFEIDILPLLKYFGTSDRQKMIDYYKNGLTYDQIAEKNNIFKDHVFRDMSRIKNTMYDIQNNSDAKKFDFDYYLEVINNPNLPFYRNLDLATKVFDLTFGMNGEERLGFPEIGKKLNLNTDVTSISRLVYDLMLSVCKFKDGIEKENTFSYEEVCAYYKNHEDSIPDYQKRFYQNYFKRINNSKNNNGYCVQLSYNIISDLIKDKYPDAFILSNTNKEEVLNILKKYGKKINKRVKAELMSRFGIKAREFMNGRDINHVYKLLYTLDTKILEQSRQPLTLTNNKNV